MTVDQFFLYASGFAALGWVAIILLSPFWKGFDKFVMGVVVALLAVAYATLNFMDFDKDILQKFSTLDGVMDLFSHKPIVMAAWCHIMAFDLIGAVWMKKNSLKYNISHWAMIVPFVFTLMLGPIGFLLYVGHKMGEDEEVFCGELNDSNYLKERERGLHKLQPFFSFF